MAVCRIFALKNNIAGGARIPFPAGMRKLADAVPSLLLVLIVIGGILAGVFTATEAGAIAVGYALILAIPVYRELSVRQLPGLLLKSAETTAVVMLLIAASSALGWLLAYENIPQIVSESMLTISDNPVIVLLLMNLILLLVGAFLDLTPAVLIFTPIPYRSQWRWASPHCTSASC